MLQKLQQLAHHHRQIESLKLFLAAAGVYPLIPIVVSWGSNNCGGSLKKGVATAIIVSFGNAGKSSSGQYQMMTSGTDRNTGSLGGVISSFIYPREDRPRYIKGHAICFAYCLIVVVSSVIMIMYLNAQNKKKAARIAERDHPWTAEEKLPYEDDGDNVEWFKYAI